MQSSWTCLIVRGAGGAKRLYSDENYAENGTGGAEGTAYGELFI